MNSEPKDKFRLTFFPLSADLLNFVLGIKTSKLC